MYQVDQSAYWQAQAMNWGPRILIALLILVLTWAVARAVKWAMQKAIAKIAARVMAAAGPGDILVSRTVHDLVVGSGIVLRDRGPHRLKGVDGEWQLLAVAGS